MQGWTGYALLRSMRNLASFSGQWTSCRIVMKYFHVFHPGNPPILANPDSDGHDLTTILFLHSFSRTSPFRPFELAILCHQPFVEFKAVFAHREHDVV